MSKHWRLELIGAPLDGTVHESLCAAVPDRIALLFDGKRQWYKVAGMSPPKERSVR